MRNLAAQFKRHSWVVVAPVIAVAWLESVLGILQFCAMRATAGLAASATGTYVNRNHFSCLLELALPLSLLWAVCVLKQRSPRRVSHAGPAIRALALVAIAASLLAGIIVSLSRMGFLSAVAGGAVTGLIVFVSRRPTHGQQPAWRWIAATTFAVSLIAVLPTRELTSRFADFAASGLLSGEMRIQIWRDTLHLIRAYKWTGCGLGAYEHGLYLFKAAAPVNTVDFAHNDYLQIVAELGIVGAVLVAAFFGSIGYRLFAAVRRLSGGLNWELPAALLAGLLAFAIHSLADFNLYIPANALAAAWLAGVAVSPALSEPIA